MYYCVQNIFDFWIPFVSVVGALVFFARSLGNDGGAVMFSFAAALFFVTTVLFGDADLPQHVHPQQPQQQMSPVMTGVIYMFTFLTFAALLLLFSLGGLPMAKDHALSFSFIKRSVSFGSMSMASRLASTPLFFLGKFLWSKFRNPHKCTTIQIPLAKEIMRKGDLGERAAIFEEDRQRARILRRRRARTRHSSARLSAERAMIFKLFKPNADVISDSVSRRHEARFTARPNESGRARTSATILEDTLSPANLDGWRWHWQRGPDVQEEQDPFGESKGNDGPGHTRGVSAAFCLEPGGLNSRASWLACVQGPATEDGSSGKELAKVQLDKPK